VNAKPSHDDEKPRRRRAPKAAPAEPAPAATPRPKKPRAKRKPPVAEPEPEPVAVEPEAAPVIAPKRRARKSVAEKVLIGWSEGVAFPEWGIKRIQAKVDTGAETSALHVENLEKLPGGKVRFEVVHNRKPPWRRRHVIAKVVKWARVRSSTGDYTRRCFVRAVARIGPVEKKIEISLVSREKMAFRMLLGRKALARDFLVDVGKRSHLGSNGAPGAGRKPPAERDPGDGEA